MVPQINKCYYAALYDALFHHKANYLSHHHRLGWCSIALVTTYTDISEQGAFHYLFKHDLHDSDRVPASIAIGLGRLELVIR